MPMVDTETSISAGFSTSVSGGNSASGRVSSSGIATKLRPPRTCDLRTNGPWKWSFPSDLCNRNVILRASEQAHGPPANTEFDSLGRLLRPCLHGFRGLFFRTSLAKQSTTNRLRMTISMATISGRNFNLLSNLWLYQKQLISAVSTPPLLMRKNYQNNRKYLSNPVTALFY